jgi:hypothetical protein
VLAHPPIARVTALNTGEVVELFDGGWLEPCRGLPHARVIVARHPPPPPDKPVRVGKRVGEWVYELFITPLDADGLPSRGCAFPSIMDVGPKLAVRASEDVEEDPDRWCSYTECGKAPLANRLSMGVEPTPLTWPYDAGRRDTR